MSDSNRRQKELQKQQQQQTIAHEEVVQEEIVTDELVGDTQVIMNLALFWIKKQFWHLVTAFLENSSNFLIIII